MKRFFALVALCALSSCGYVKDELYQTGGFVGARAESFLPAGTPQQRFDRYVIIAMILAPTALETAIDEEEAAATIRRVNALYASLADLRRSIQCGDNLNPAQNNQRIDYVRATETLADPTDKDAEGRQDPRINGINQRFLVICDARQNGTEANWPTTPGLELRGNAYSFEHLEYEVQQDLFFVARSVVTNLELNAEAEELLRLNTLTLARLWTRVEDLLPMFRETAARFRGGVILFADITQASCLPRIGTDCARLRAFMAQKFRATPTNRLITFGDDLPQRDVRRMLTLVKSAFDTQYWRLTDPQYVAVLQQIDHSCAVAYHRQGGPDGTSSDASRPHCGFGVPRESGEGFKLAPSPERTELINAIRMFPFEEPQLGAVAATPQAATTGVGGAGAEGANGAETLAVNEDQGEGEKEDG